MYRPASPFTTPALILKAEYRKVNGVNVKKFVETDLIYISAKSYGGTETVVNDKVTIVDTLNIETWFHPEITSKDAIRLLEDNSEWEIMNTPEDIEFRHQFLKFKVRRMIGNA